MFPYTIKYTESEYDIQNNDLLYKINQQYQHAFDFCRKDWKNIEKSKKYFLFCYLYMFHNSKFVENIYVCFYCFSFIYILHV